MNFFTKCTKFESIKTFAYNNNKKKVTQKQKISLGKLKNIVEKGENAGLQACLKSRLRGKGLIRASVTFFVW